jgi:hypothetical protein
MKPPVKPSKTVLTLGILSFVLGPAGIIMPVLLQSVFRNSSGYTLSLFFIFPIAGLALGIVAIVKGVRLGKKKGWDSMTTTGFVLGVLGVLGNAGLMILWILTVTLVAAFAGVFLSQIISQV